MTMKAMVFLKFFKDQLEENMTLKFNPILDGKYFYRKKKQSYCEENFWVSKQSSSRGDYLFKAEVLSRSHNGEFLKVEVHYLTSFDFTPKKVEIERSMGSRVSTETFELEGQNQALEYYFFDGNETQRFSHNVASNIQIAAPAFSSSLLMTLKKKLDPVQRSQYNVLCSQNIWSYESPLVENEIFLEMVDPAPIDLKIGDQHLPATHCIMSGRNSHLSDSAASKSNEEVFLSKHFSIPYKGIFKNDITIELAQLNVN